MVSFRVAIDVRAPPEFVVDWWLDYTSKDPELGARMKGREVEKIDDRTVRLRTDSEFGGRIRTTAGTVTRTGPSSWHMTAHVSSEGKVVSTAQTSYSVRPSSDGSRLEAEFEFQGRTLPWRLVLFLSGFTIRRDRVRSFNAYARAIESDYAAIRAEPTTAAVPTEATSSSGPRRE
jgi:hypothetical protein